jgi:hypothetical protein
MSVARMSGPQTLYPALRPAQQPVDVAAVSVGTDLRHDPARQPYQGLGQSAFDPEDPLESGERYLRLLPHSVLAGALGHQRDSYSRQSLTQLLALVGQVSEESPRQIFPEVRTTNQFTNQSDFRYVGRAQFVGDGHAVGGAQQMQLHPIDGEGTPPYPRCSVEACRLIDLARMQYLQKRRVYEEGFGLSDQLGQDLLAQGLKEASQLSHPPMQRGGVHPLHAREQMDKEPLEVAQEGALGLHAPQLLEERQGEDLGVGELFERLVALPPRVEQCVGVVDEAEQEGECLFQGSEGGGMLWMGHPRYLSSGSRMAFFVPSIHATHI